MSEQKEEIRIGTIVVPRSLITDPEMEIIFSQWDSLDGAKIFEVIAVPKQKEETSEQPIETYQIEGPDQEAGRSAT